MKSKTEEKNENNARTRKCSIFCHFAGNVKINMRPVQIAQGSYETCANLHRFLYFVHFKQSYAFEAKFEVEKKPFSGRLLFFKGNVIK